MSQRPFQSFDDVTSAAGGAARSVADAARQAQRKVQGEAQQAAERLWTAGERLSDQASAAAGRYAGAARNAAERIGSLAGHVRSIRTEDVTSGVKDFVARHPATLLGAVVAGFLLGRSMRNR